MNEITHEYLLEFQRYLGGRHRFMVVAHSREEALQIGLESPEYRLDGDQIRGSLKVIRKLKPSH